MAGGKYSFVAEADGQKLLAAFDDMGCTTAAAAGAARALGGAYAVNCGTACIAYGMLAEGARALGSARALAGSTATRVAAGGAVFFSGGGFALAAAARSAKQTQAYPLLVCTYVVQ